MVVPYPPQPVYKCPDWETISSSPTSVVMSKLPGEIQLTPSVLIMGAKVNLTVNYSHDGMFVVCTLPHHCRMVRVDVAACLRGG